MPMDVSNIQKCKYDFTAKSMENWKMHLTETNNCQQKEQTTI